MWGMRVHALLSALAFAGLAAFSNAAEVVQGIYNPINSG
jgi:hypothetical protein